MDPARARQGITAWERREARAVLREVVPGAVSGPAPPEPPAGLFDRAAAARWVEAWRAARGQPGEPDARRLAARVARGHAAARLAPLREHVARREQAASIRAGEVVLPFADTGSHLLGSPERVVRQALAEAQSRVLTEELNPGYAELAAALRDAARDLGFADHAARCDALEALGITSLEAELDGLLRRTETLYRWHTEGLLGRSVQVVLAMGEWHDLARAVALPWFDDAFPAAGSRPAVDQLLEALGLRAPGLHIHDTPTPKGWPAGALALAESIPGEVHLVLRRGSGLVAWRAAFHEAATAARWAATPPGPAAEDALLLDPAVAEAFGILVEGIVAEPSWAARHLSPDLADRHVWQQRVLRLLAVRRAAGLLRAELALHRDGPARAGVAYQRGMDRALVVAHDPARALLDMLGDGDEAFGAAATLRAHTLAAALQTAARARFGAAWWERPEAGAWLRALWSRSPLWDVEALTQELGAKPGLEPLIASLVEDLREEPRSYQALPRF